MNLAFGDRNALENVVRGSRLCWALVRLVIFRGREESSVRVFGAGLRSIYNATVARDSVALFVADRYLEGCEWFQKTRIIANLKKSVN